MGEVKRDEFLLEMSSRECIGTIVSGIRINVSLSPNPYLYAGTIYGNVTNSSGSPLSRAVITLLRDGCPLTHVLTDSSGNYLISPVLPGTGYKLYAFAPDYLLDETAVFCLTNRENVKRNIVLQADPSAFLSVISGQVTNEAGCAQPNAVVNLYTVDASGTETLYAETLTNCQGLFIFADLTVGNYVLKVRLSGYSDFSKPITITNLASITNLTVCLKLACQASKGTLTGVVSDEHKKPLPDVDVVLYLVEADNSLLPIEYTKTNKDGVYFFGNLPAGCYKINANRQLCH